MHPPSSPLRPAHDPRNSTVSQPPNTGGRFVKAKWDKQTRGTMGGEFQGSQTQQRGAPHEHARGRRRRNWPKGRPRLHLHLCERRQSKNPRGASADPRGSPGGSHRFRAVHDSVSGSRTAVHFDNVVWGAARSSRFDNRTPMSRTFLPEARTSLSIDWLRMRIGSRSVVWIFRLFERVWISKFEYFALSVTVRYANFS